MQRGMPKEASGIVCGQPLARWIRLDETRARARESSKRLLALFPAFSAAFWSGRPVRSFCFYFKSSDHQTVKSHFMLVNQ